MELKTYYIPKDSTQNFLVKFFDVTVEPFNRRFVNHKHTYFEMTYFKSAFGVYKTSNAEFDIQPGDIFVFSSNEPHCIVELNSKAPISFTNIHFDPKLLWGNDLKALSFANPDICFKHSKMFQNRLLRNHPATEKIIKLFAEIGEEFKNKSDEYELSVNLNIIKIILTLIRDLEYMDKNQESVNSQIKHIESVKIAMEYINNNLSEDISLNEIADKVGLSPNYFSTIFKEATSASIWSYLTSKRISWAMLLMNENPDHKIIDIATQCGFNNTANFNKAFKKHTGLTPSEFKKYGSV